MAVAVCPGSFDPVTLGHVDIVSRASVLFDKVIVAVMVNPSKHPAFTAVERTGLLKKTFSDIKNIEITTFDGLLIDLVAEKKRMLLLKAYGLFLTLNMSFRWP